MTLRKIEAIEVETYREAIHQLGLENIFSDVFGEQLSDFTTSKSTPIPVTLLVKTLDEAPGDYWLDTPELGSDVRFRIIPLHTNTGPYSKPSA